MRCSIRSSSAPSPVMRPPLSTKPKDGRLNPEPEVRRTSSVSATGCREGVADETERLRRLRHGQGLSSWIENRKEAKALRTETTINDTPPTFRSASDCGTCSPCGRSASPPTGVCSTPKRSVTARSSATPSSASSPNQSSERRTCRWSALRRPPRPRPPRRRLQPPTRRLRQSPPTRAPRRASRPKPRPDHPGTDDLRPTPTRPPRAHRTNTSLPPLPPHATWLEDLVVPHPCLQPPHSNRSRRHRGPQEYRRPQPRPRRPGGTIRTGRITAPNNRNLSQRSGSAGQRPLVRRPSCSR